MNKKLITAVALCGMMASVASAAIYRFDSQAAGGDDDWTNGDNWVNQDDGNSKGVVPSDLDEARFNYGGAEGVLTTDVGTIAKLQLGLDDTGGKLTVSSTGVLSVTGDFNTIGWDAGGNGGILIVNGGQITYGGWVSVANVGTGTFELNGGLVRVENAFYHNLYNNGGTASSSITDGLLDVNAMALNSGVMDISGDGEVLIRAGTSEAQIAGWISSGLMTINGSGTAVLDTDYALTAYGGDGQRITAIPEPATLGLLAVFGGGILFFRRNFRV
jgi:hypothetical protein